MPRTKVQLRSKWEYLKKKETKNNFLVEKLSLFRTDEFLFFYVSMGSPVATLNNFFPKGGWYTLLISH